MTSSTQDDRSFAEALQAAAGGGADGADRLLGMVYDQLRQLAAQKLAMERPGHTLQATALVHEAYLRLLSRPVDQPWDGRRHFFAAAAEAMRRILIDNARRKQRLRHGGDAVRQPLEEIELPGSLADQEAIAIHEVLDLLAAAEPLKAELVKLRFFAGLDEMQAAEVLGISRATAARHWAFAKAWLYERLHP
jgi:RNA polymerase sigma factor (TIGR02999 family)